MGENGVSFAVVGNRTREQVSLTSLFSPGEGGAPPFLAGRESELEQILAIAERLRYEDPDTRVPASSIVILGPRGNGKTVLLNEAVKRITDHVKNSGQTLQAINLTARVISTKDELRRALTPTGGWKPFWDRLKSVRQIEISSLKISLDDANEPLLKDVLAARANAGPVLITVDEAHELDLGVGGDLLDLVQNARTARLPVLLMLAGTPALQDQLNRMQVSFWDRCLLLPVDRLDPKAAEDALLKPLDSRDISFDSEALQDVVERTNGYPYFLQLWGSAVCVALLEKSRREQLPQTCIDRTVVERAAPRADQRVRTYYGNRYSELRRIQLLDVAFEITELFQRIRRSGRPDRAYDTELTETIKRALPEDDCEEQVVNDVFDQLKRLGFVWEVGDSFEPGIPSLMSYVADRYQAGIEARQQVLDDEVPF